MSGPWTWLTREVAARVRTEGQLAEEHGLLADTRAELSEVYERLAATEAERDRALTALAGTGEGRARIALGAVLARPEVQRAVPAPLMQYWRAQHAELAAPPAARLPLRSGA